MIPTAHDDPARLRGQVAGVVRGEALWAAIAAGLLLYFGFNSVWTSTSWGTWFVDVAMKGGGIALVLSAVLLLTGWRGAILFDGLVSLVVGALFALSVPFGVMFLYLIFGIVFMASGWRNINAFRDLGKLALAATAHTARDHRAAPPKSASSRPVPPPAEPLSPPAESPAIPAPQTPASSPQAPAEPPPDGFLASFADRPLDQRPE